jgi:hypothetical protein
MMKNIYAPIKLKLISKYILEKVPKELSVFLIFINSNFSLRNINFDYIF